MGSERLFLGFAVPDEARKGLREFCRYQQQTHVVLAEDMKWVPEANYHVTLHFLGHRDDRKIWTNAVRKVIAGCSGFTLGIDGISAFPSLDQPEVVWAGPAEIPDSLQILYDRCKKSLHDLGLPTEDRRYVPHVTLARRVKRSTHPELACDLSHPVAIPPWDVKQVFLYRSRLTDQGSHYDVVDQFPLKD